MRFGHAITQYVILERKMNMNTITINKEKIDVQNDSLCLSDTALYILWSKLKSLFRKNKKEFRSITNCKTQKEFFDKWDYVQFINTDFQ